MRSARPCSRSQHRSAIVALEPGRITRSGARNCAGGSAYTHAHARLERERPEFVEVRQVRQAHHGDLDQRRRRVARGQRGRVLVGQAEAVQIGHHAQHRHAGALREQLGRWRKQRGVAAEPVQHEAAHQRALVGRQPLQRAEQRRERAAAIDVARPGGRRRAARMQRDAHVDDVARAQVDLGWAARALAITRSYSARSRSSDRPRPASSRVRRAPKYSAAVWVPTTWPRITTCEAPGCGLSRIGFMSTVGATPAAVAWAYCARPISPPSAHTAALLDMFCALNGATLSPRLASSRHNPATSVDLPTDEAVPWTIKSGARPSARANPHLRHRAQQSFDLRRPLARHPHVRRQPERGAIAHHDAARQQRPTKRRPVAHLDQHEVRL